MTGTVHGILDAAADRHGDRPAVRDRRTALTYRRLQHESMLMAGALTASGVRHGDRVVTVLGSRHETTSLFYAVSRIGAVFVPASPRGTDFQLRELLRDAEPSLVVTSADQRDRLRPFTAAPVVECGDLPAVGSPDASAQPTATADDVALMLYTSGSTAHPKAVVSRQRQVTFVAGAIAQRLGYRADDAVFTCLPLSFDYGLYQVLLCALAGAELVLSPETPDGGLLREIRDTGATVLPAVPTLVELLAWLSRRDREPTSVRLVTNTGAALTQAHAGTLQTVFPAARVIAMYGTTECKRITIAEPDEHLHRPGSVGRPLSGTAIRIVDEDGTELPAGEVGEVLVTGPHVMDGYWRAPEETAQRFRPGPLLHTGDYGRVDEHGRLYLEGRRDDLFKRRGIRTSVQEIEAAFLDVPGVRAAAVVAPDDTGRLRSWVVSDRPTAELLAGVDERLGRAKVPDSCVLVDALPRTVNGKVDKAALRDRMR
jgi:amino acid adenylation domain-containing protein